MFNFAPGSASLSKFFSHCLAGNDSNDGAGTNSFSTGRLELLEPHIVPNTYMVTSTADSGVGSLRDAINQVNAGADNSIAFNIATTDGGYNATNHSFTIDLASALPALSKSVTIDGTTENAFLLSNYSISVSTPVIVLDGTNAAGGDGLDLFAGNTTVKGLVIDNFTGGAGILLSGNSVTNDIIAGNFIGTDVTGSTAAGDGDGILVTSEAHNNIIGGTTAATRNVISGNTTNGVEIEGQTTTDNFVEGNYIGTDAAGTAGLGNGNDGIFLSAGGNTIGGSGVGAGNVISSNGTTYSATGDDGIEITGVAGVGGYISANNLVEGNFIGTDKTGMHALGNTGSGIRFDDNASGNIIGGGTASATGVITPGVGSLLGFSNAYVGNLISGNQLEGVYLDLTLTAGPANNNFIEGNYIGIAIDGQTALANLNGIMDDGGAFDNTIGGTAKGTGNVISGNSQDGVSFLDPSGLGTTGNVVEGNYIGTDATGSFAVANTYGVGITSGAYGNTIGGTSPQARNVISGNSESGVYIAAVTSFNDTTDNLVEGNYIGINAAGNAALGNVFGVDITGGVADDTVAGNVISGNTIGVALESSSTGNVIEGNFIGTNPGGTAAIGNTFGVDIQSGANKNTVGGTTAAARNIISGNTAQGMQIGDSFPANTTENVVEGNFIGTDVTGTIGLGDGNESIAITDATDTQIGGLTSTPGTGAGNVISGAAVLTSYNDYGIVATGQNGGSVIEGNIIGLNAAGTSALADSDGIYLLDAKGVTVGGTTAGSRNVISGNEGGGSDHGSGVQISDSTGIVVEGNYIGTDLSGTNPERNQNSGIKIDSGSSNNTIGGDAANAGNLIYFNDGYGVDTDGSTSTANVVLGELDVRKHNFRNWVHQRCHCRVYGPATASFGLHEFDEYHYRWFVHQHTQYYVRCELLCQRSGSRGNTISARRSLRPMPPEWATSNQVGPSAVHPARSSV